MRCHFISHFHVIVASRPFPAGEGPTAINTQCARMGRAQSAGVCTSCQQQLQGLKPCCAAGIQSLAPSGVDDSRRTTPYIHRTGVISMGLGSWTPESRKPRRRSVLGSGEEWGASSGGSIRSGPKRKAFDRNGGSRDAAMATLRARCQLLVCAAAPPPRGQSRALARAAAIFGTPKLRKTRANVLLS